ncbi:MAG TPA: hypothetical protein VLF18_17640 [Tahibacter sp.]|uniref:hypothetical protein n=1 Tax=Tahibacter sp. TaxID=2056211 RepID=UPI002CA083E2|nr:hypothetical protein [Tahibacter sp.]HSX62013.1 hypothetical protein [Tahibacter sp.]
MTLIRRSTPVLAVASVEPTCAFFEKLGLAVTVGVPHGDRLGFAILADGAVEIMVQSHDSIGDDLGASLTIGRNTALFVEVSDLDAALAALGDAPVFLPRRRTFYGSVEVGVVEPGGHHVTLAQFEREGT